VPTDALLKRIRGEFLEMPGLRLTCEQAQRLYGLDRALCQRALDWLVDPTHRADAVAIYRKNIPAASDASAAKALEMLAHGNEGFAKRAKLDRAGMETVLKLRSEFGEPKKALTDPMKYVDESYYNEAMR